jgi:hypothetical protein
MEHAGNPDHHDHHDDIPSDVALRVKALESLLIEKGLVDPAAPMRSSRHTSTRWVRITVPVW